MSPFLVIVAAVAFIYGAGRWFLWWLPRQPGLRNGSGFKTPTGGGGL